MRNWILFTALLGFLQSNAQNGAIKGTVIDKQSEGTLMGAAVELIDSGIGLATITNEDGRFELAQVAVGRHTVRVSYLGYETITLPNIEVTSGKDVFITVALLESFEKLDEVVLTGNAQKEIPINKMAAVSARQFGLEEVTRFSGGRSDVGRLAANFAGVSSPDDSRNDIVVWGNAPTGLLWRLEGIPIPSPNHFGTVGTTGGPVSALNPNMLKNSDFLISAFPAEYGNALGGVFDLGFRNGNVDGYEYTFQTGIFTGLEAMAEGPMGSKKGSFLVAYRYSLVGLLGIGAGGTSATPNYNDLSFNLDFGTGRKSAWSVFVILGSSDIAFLGDDINPDDLFAAQDENTYATSNFGVLGLKHRLALGDNAYLRTVVAGSYSGNEFTLDRFVDKATPQERILPYTTADNAEMRYTWSTLYNAKMSSRITFRVGVLAELFNAQIELQDRDGQPDANGDGDPDLFTFINTNDQVLLVQPFAQGQFRLAEELTVNAGLHGQYSQLNGQFALEPRLALSYGPFTGHKFNIGYGLHQQNVPLPLLFLNEEVNGSLVRTNENLDFVRSNHFVLGYDVKLNSNWRGKLEVYYQAIDRAGVEQFPSAYSTLTEGADFGFSTDNVSLVSAGKGKNLGIEITVERFFSKGYYTLLTGSFFESTYTGSDGIQRSTPFNNGYVMNFLTGKEYKIGKTGRHILFADTRLTTAGGRFYTPIDLPASQQAGFAVYQDALAFSEQYEPYFRWDLKFGVKLNSAQKKVSHQFYLDLQNVSANENIFARRYNRVTNSIDRVDQIGFFPDFGYKFQF